MSIVQRLLAAGSALVLLALGAAVSLLRAGTPLPWIAAAVGLVALATAGVLALWTARSLRHPLSGLITATRAISAGRFSVRAPRSRLGQIDLLAQSFNEMAEALESYNSSSIDRLLAEQRRSEAVLACIDDGLVIFDGHARIERINRVAARQLGVSPEAVIGHTFDDVISHGGLDDTILAAIRTQLPPLVEGDLELGEGDLRRTLARALLPFHDLTRPGLVMLLRDVTDERHLERMRTEFVLRASHELRTPVSGLRMAIDLLGERAHFAPGTREQDLFDTVRDETARLSALIEDLLDLSRLEQKETPLKLESCAIAQLAEAAYLRFVPMAGERGVTLLPELAPNLPELSLDPARLSRVLDNLLGNAIRHTPAGGSVRLRAEPQPDAVRIEVIDTGEGMPRWQLNRIFDPFVQFGRNPGGAGLGLTLCREIVDQHGGRIDVQSAPGRGTRFSVRLPRPGMNTKAALDSIL